MKILLPSVSTSNPEILGNDVILSFDKENHLIQIDFGDRTRGKVNLDELMDALTIFGSSTRRNRPYSLPGIRYPYNNPIPRPQVPSKPPSNNELDFLSEIQKSLILSKKENYTTHYSSTDPTEAKMEVELLESGKKFLVRVEEIDV